MPSRRCRVSFTDAGGTAHITYVQAGSLFEAAVLGLQALDADDVTEAIGPYTRITVRLEQPPAEHFVMFAQLLQWLDRRISDPAAQTKKDRLKSLLKLPS